MRCRIMNLTNIKEDEINFEDLKFLLKSNIRLNILVNLYFGKKNLSGLREELGKSSASLLHVLSELSSRKMVLKSERNYYLSSKGYLFALNLIKLFMNWNSFTRLESFWIKHDLNMIPIEFFQSSYLLVNSEIVKSEEVDFAKPLKAYLELLPKSKILNVTLPIFSDIHLNALFKEVEKGCKLNLITTPYVLESFRQKGFMKKLLELSQDYDVTLWRCDDLNFFMTCSENFMSLNLFFMDNHYDDSEMLLNKDEKGIIWGKYLFDYLLNKSVKIIL